MDLQKLLDFSKELDIRFTEGKGLTKEEILNNSLLALNVECAELSNELNQWKYWKNNKTIDYDKADGELGDTLFVLFSICNQLGYDGTMLEEIFIRTYVKNINRIKEGY